jgi:hypothetical protein
LSEELAALSLLESVDLSTFLSSFLAVYLLLLLSVFDDATDCSLNAFVSVISVSITRNTRTPTIKIMIDIMVFIKLPTLNEVINIFLDYTTAD